jgi:sulfite exporter TauE/SafE
MNKNNGIPACPHCVGETKGGQKTHPIIFILLAAALLIVYYLLLKGGAFALMAKLNDSRLSYGLIFIIGVLASFHCVGMCGSFVAAYSAKQIEKGCVPTGKSHGLYNLGRFISYTLIGGLLGLFGSIFQVNGVLSGFLLLLAGTFMAVMGLSLLTGWKPLDRVKLMMPAFLSHILLKLNRSGSKQAPLLIGLLTALMPCGPLQAMQLYALSTGSAWKGALAMAFYAAGTIPMMFVFGSFLSSLSGAKIKNMLKVSGAIVLVLGLLTAARGFSDSGLQRQVSKPLNKAAGKQDVSAEQYFSDSVPTDKYQTVEMEITSSGFKPNVIKIKRGLPVRWIIKDGGVTGCTNEVILYNGGQELRYKISSPQTIVKFMPADSGEIRFSCWMKMVWGKFVLNSDSSLNTEPGAKTEQLASCHGGSTADNGQSCSGNGSCGKEPGGCSCGCGKK